MPELFASLPAVLAGWLLTYLVHSTVVISAVWAVCACGWVRAPETQDLIWKLALLAGVVTAIGAQFGPTSRPGGAELMTRVEAELMTRVETELMTRVEAQLRATTVAVPQLERWSALPDLGVRSIEAQIVAPTPACRTFLTDGGLASPGWEGRVADACGAPRATSWYHALLLIWFVGSGFVVLGLLRSRRAVAELGRTLVPAGPRAHEILREVLEGTGLTPRLMTSDSLDAPCVMDHRTIALPTRCEEGLGDDELRAVLAHEVAHVARRDVAWLRVGRMVSGLLWVQPLNRVALQGVVDAAELVCDDWALTRTRQRLGLARSISRVAEWAVAEHRRPAAVVAMAGRSGRSLSGRVRRILTGESPDPIQPRWKRVTGAAALLTPLLILPAVPGPTQPGLFVGSVDEGHREALLGGSPDGALRFERSIRVRLSDGGAADVATRAERILVTRVEHEVVRPGS